MERKTNGLKKGENYTRERKMIERKKKERKKEKIRKKEICRKKKDVER